MEGQEPKKDLLLPASILIAAVLVSVSLIYSTGKKGETPSENLQGNLEEALTTDKVIPVTSKDHILGNPNAPVKIIEFSDLECPFCKRFHPVLKQVLEEYGDQVAWVYRHFPLDSLHPKARKESEATECAWELGGNTAFWKYIDQVYEITPSNNGLDLALLPKIATDIGLDKTKFEACLESGKYAEKISKQVEDAVNSGGRGTPFSLVIAKNGKKFVIPGALPFEGNPSVKTIVDAALNEK